MVKLMTVQLGKKFKNIKVLGEKKFYIKIFFFCILLHIEFHDIALIQRKTLYQVSERHHIYRKNKPRLSTIAPLLTGLQ